METEKKYTDLVAKLKEWHDGLQDGAPAKETLELILPQFAESEDERIRKALVKHFQDKKNCVGDTWAGMNIDDVLAYLERKKEIQFGVPGLYYYDGEKVHYYGSPATEEKIEKQDVDFSTNDTSKK